jgi:hypothetical protein
VLATQILEALQKSKIEIVDNRLTMAPAGTMQLGVTIDGHDADLVKELKAILSNDGNLLNSSILGAPLRGGISTSVAFGMIEPRTPAAATITVGVKPIT